MISNGVSYSITLILEDSRLSRLQHNIERDNQSVRNKEAKSNIKEFILEKISKGYLLLILKWKVMDIPKVETYPIHII